MGSSKPAEEEKKMMPVFTVIKNGVILKNIFVISKAPTPFSDYSIPGDENVENPDRESEEILVVGRHPDCNIVLMHPSISRFHLQINSIPSSQKLFVTDLSSVHGTWLSEEKIEPGFRVELNEGDTIRVGASTRIYRLHWVPFSHAYDVENPFVSAPDVAMIEKKEEENVTELTQDEHLLVTEKKDVEERETFVVLGQEEETYQDTNSLLDENGEIQSIDSMLEGISSLFPDENVELSVKKEISSATSMPKDMNFSFHGEKEEIGGSPRSDDELSLKTVDGVALHVLTQQFYECNQSPECYSAKEAALKEDNTDISMIRSELKPNVEMNSGPVLVVKESEANSFFDMRQETENQCLSTKDHEQIDSFPIESVNRSLLVEDLSETNVEQLNKENQTLALLHPPYEGEQENSSENQTLNLMVSQQTVCPDDLAATEVLEEIGSPTREDYGQNEFTSVYYSELPATGSVNSSLPLGELLLETVDSKEIHTPQSDFPENENTKNLRSPPIRSEKKSSSCNIWSRRGKPATALQLQTSNSRRTRSSNVQHKNHEADESKSITRALFSDLEAKDEETFTPDKENRAPNTYVQKFFRRSGKLDDIQLPKLCRSSSPVVSFSPIIGPGEDIITSSDKENQTHKVLQQRKSARPTSRHQMKLEEDMVLKEGRVGRIPLQSSFSNSPGRNIFEASPPDAASRSNNSIIQTQTIFTNSTSINSVGDGRRKWTMIADATSLLDRDSRKSLQLLEDLKGTHLIIPRMVIRELDSLKTRGRLFRRTTEASLVLNWIEECMVKIKWWIHVQSSAEDPMPIAATPPASPVSQLSDGTWGFPCWRTSSASIVSPTAEDYILDYALSHRKVDNDGQLVLLSNDVTLKIKSMAEGLICETAQEFRDSLVNPFSERFLWADSSPRGQTWCVFDDVVLKEKYYKSPSKKSAKGDAAKGLKLILLQNSQYGLMSQSTC